MNAPVTADPAVLAQRGGYAPSEAESSSLELRDVIRVLSDHRRLIAAAGAIGLVLGIIGSLLMTPLYRATALLEINNQANEMVETSARAQQSSIRGANPELIATQMGLLRSEALARRVVEDLNLASNPEFGGEEGTREQRTERAVALVRAATSVDQVKGSMLIQVSDVARSPAMAANIANAVANGFISSSIERRFDATSYARKFLSDQLARTKAALEESERNLNAYSIQSGVFRSQVVTTDGKTAEGASLAQTSLSALNDALAQARIKRINAEQAYKNAEINFVSEQATGSSVLIGTRADLQAQYEEKLKLFKPEYPAMRELKARIDRMQASIDSERSRVKGDKRAELLGEYRTALKAEAQIAAQVAAAKGEVQGERGRSIQYNILQREADTNRALYDALLQRYKEVGVAGSVGQSNVSIVDTADPPSGPFRPKLMVNMLAGMILGLGAGVALAFIIHLLFDAIVGPEDIRNKLHMPVLGVVPMDREERSLMEALADRKSDISEAYYSVRTALKFSNPAGAPRTLLITSTRPAEGKSTSAYAIASSMARLGSRVLLIDADLRKPTFVSNRPDGYGLAHLLGSDEPMTSYIEPTQSPNLSLLPVGRYVGSAAELLSSNRLPAIIAEARGKFDMVVIDGPPVLGLTDAPLLGASTDATALVVESRQSRTAAVHETARRLTESGNKLVGVILTKYNATGIDYNYYSYTYGSDDKGGKVSSDPARALDLGGAAADS